jgi:ribonuclease D
MTQFSLVDPTTDLHALDGIPAAGTIGVDTEFMREKTFFAELCLIQVSTPNEILCIDPLPAAAGTDTDWWDRLMSAEWVVHSARQDIEVIYQSSGKMPGGVFDTQVAAALLGHQPQMGYAGLVHELFDVSLDKSHTRANWARRPLPDAQLKYAAEDVQYLLPAWDKLVSGLEREGRLQWALEDSADLLNPELYSTDPDLAIQKLKGARNLRGRQRAAATGLASWREREALRTNKPRQWILRDSVLIDIVMSAPGAVADLADIDGLAERTARRAGKAIIDIVRHSSGEDCNYQPPPRPDEKQKSALKAMQKLVQKYADELGLAAEIVAPKKELSAAVLGQRDGRLFKGWRRELVGDQLLELIQDG